ncbi:MAG: TelA-like protein [Firmicutes bacterium ADurb.Bin146]|nr:MAG: TelA-like protein [Firmicutes bacterium ADurb.Bin146]
MSEITLTEKDRELATSYGQKLDIKSSASILQYGADAQRKITSFSDATLEKVRSRELGEIGDMIGNLMAQLKDFTADQETGNLLERLFKKTKRYIDVLKARYAKAEANVNKIVAVLEDHQVVLLKDITMLDKMYEMNLDYIKELALYIEGGRAKLNELKETKLVELRDKAKESKLPEDAQAANDFANMLDRVEKKIYDLEITRNIAVQMAPQIRLIQNNNNLLTEKIQTTLINTIPLWKNQMVLSLSITHSQNAMKAQRAVTDMTNELLLKNAESLKQGSIDIAKESERGIVDIETLRTTNESLINTLDEILRIQEEGKAKRKEAETELNRIEEQLKNKLLEFKN